VLGATVWVWRRTAKRAMRVKMTNILTEWVEGEVFVVGGDG